jgi:phage/plasmid-like protein (TIGR03299 family)
MTIDSMYRTPELPKMSAKGTLLDKPQTAADAIIEAGLDWSVLEQDIFFQSSNQSTFYQIPNRKALIRSDTLDTLGIFSKGYEVVQNRDAFGMFDEVIGAGEAIYHSAGSLDGGKKVWVMAKLPTDIEIIPNDKVGKFILLTNTHDGSRSLRMSMMAQRFACWNSISAVLRRTSSTDFVAKHTKNVLNKASEARQILGLADVYYDILAKQIDELVNTRWNTLQTHNYIKDVLGFDDERETQDHRLVKTYDAVVELLEHPLNVQGGIKGTKWAAFNAFTHYIDHERPVRVGQRDDRNEKRLENSWFGRGESLRQRAYDHLWSDDSKKVYSAAGI